MHDTVFMHLHVGLSLMAEARDDGGETRPSRRVFSKKVGDDDVALRRGNIFSAVEEDV